MLPVQPCLKHKTTLSKRGLLLLSIFLCSQSLSYEKRDFGKCSIYIKSLLLNFGMLTILVKTQVMLLKTPLHIGVHNFKCKGSLYGRTGGYAHD